MLRAGKKCRFDIRKNTFVVKVHKFQNVLIVNVTVKVINSADSTELIHSSCNFITHERLKGKTYTKTVVCLQQDSLTKRIPLQGAFSRLRSIGFSWN